MRVGPKRRISLRILVNLKKTWARSSSSVEDPIPGEYNLEVSSPGLNRRLVKAEHFERFAGNRVKVKLKTLVEGRRNFKAKRVGFDDPNVLLKEGKSEFSVPLQEIEMARVVPKY